MRLTYIYHSGFAIEADEFAILIDYYKDTGRSPEKGFVHEKLLNRAGTLYVLSSHFHPDHFNPEVLRWKTYKKDIYNRQNEKYEFSKRKVQEETFEYSLNEVRTSLFHSVILYPFERSHIEFKQDIFTTFN